MTALRSVSRYSHFIAAPPGIVFPLLCPVREYEWIDVWQGKLLYARSGAAEEDCIFTSHSFDEIGPETWVCSRYEPPLRIDYLRFTAHTVIRLELTLKPADTGTDLAAAFVATGITGTGKSLVAGFGPATCTEFSRPCFLMLDHFVRTGTMLPAAEAKTLAGAPLV